MYSLSIKIGSALWPNMVVSIFETYWYRKIKNKNCLYAIAIAILFKSTFCHILINSCAKSAWYARRQHSYNICKDFLSHNSSMKNLNFTNSCTINMNWNIYTYDTFLEKSVETINSNNSTKFEVNWRRGSQFTARRTKNRLQFDE